jgi:hypothetical protein
MSTRKKSHVPQDVLADIPNWITPAEFAKDYPNIATEKAIAKDIWLRKTLGLESAGAVRRVGRKFLVHRVRYAAYRLHITNNHGEPT